VIGDFEAWLFGEFVQPLIYALGLMVYVEDAFQWMEFALYGVLQVILTYLICRPLEAWRPVEPRADSAAIRTDVVYTMLQRLGVLPLVFFVLFLPLADWFDGGLRELGYVPRTIDQWIPALADQPLVTFVLYALILDFAEYWRHRLQHGLGWWWALHSLHHDQRQMTLWSDNRNHVLDDVTQAAWFSAVAHLIGVEPGEFPLLVLLFGIVESLSHANARLSFGAIGDRLLVGPRFHREHHALGYRPGEPPRACNFAALFPLWDIVFGTADFGGRYAPTGVEGRSAPEAIGRGWLMQQWLGFGRLARALMPRGAGRDSRRAMARD
jgi:sterol desaturase/sphingolipid hydroxylase (fatty acid hydroxylase superfamily)